jgi:dCTP deaminase
MSNLDAIHMTPGVLAKRQLDELVKYTHISSIQFGPPDTGTSAVDLRLSSKAWKLKSGQRPTTREMIKIQAQSDEVRPEKDADGLYFQFERNSIYLVELDEHLKLPPNISGRASGKSSVGRLDVITRLLTTRSREYDIVTSGYEGPLYLLIMPQTFAIRVAPGASVNQLRLFCGSQSSSVITREELPQYGTEFWHVLKDEVKDDYEAWGVREDDQVITTDPLLSDLTVDLGDPKFPYILRALSDVSDAVDLRKNKSRSLDPHKFFEELPVLEDGPDRSVVLEPRRFHIMKSRERLAIPEDVAVEVVAISERIGDIRIHYAGFAHPGFGRAVRKPRRGTPLIFEVRATDMPTKLYDRSLLARIQLFRMSERAAPTPSTYGHQELKLSDLFGDWTPKAP